MPTEQFVAAIVPKEKQSLLTALSGLPALLWALETADPNWLGPDPRTALDHLLHTTFTQAVKKLQTLPEAQQSRWGTLHTATFRHLMEKRDPALAKAFNVGPFERSGDGNTPNNTRFDEKFNQITFSRRIVNDVTLHRLNLKPGRRGSQSRDRRGAGNPTAP